MIALLLLAVLAALADPTATPESLTWAHDTVWIGTAWEAGTSADGVGPSDLFPVAPGFALDARTVSDGPRWLGAGTNQHFRLSRDADGRTVVDELSLQARIAALAIRPATGDLLDLSVIGSRWDQTVYAVARPWTRLQLFVPLHLVALGFSDTDADTDHRLHYHATAGAGIGADWLAQVAGAFGLHLRAEASGETMHRLVRDAPDEVRYTVWGRGEADLAVLDTDAVWTLGVWADLNTSWEPRVTSGVNKQVLAGGLRFGLRVPTRSLPHAGTKTPAPDASESANDQNEKAIEGAEHPPPDSSSPPPPATDEEHEANDAANQQKIDRQ